MGFLLMLSRKMQLQERQNNIEFQMTSINSKLNDLTSFASILSQDSINLSDISALPSSLFAAGMAELTNAHYQALQISQAQYNQAVASGMFGQGGNPQIEQIAQQKMYENARKQIQKQLQVKLNEEEKSLQARKARLDSQLKQIETELQAVDQRQSQDIKNSICSYGLQG